MKKSEGSLRKRISDNPIPEETSQEMRAEVATNSSQKATSTTIAENSFFSGIFQRLVCSPSSKLPDDKSETVSIPKAQPK